MDLIDGYASSGDEGDTLNRKDPLFHNDTENIGNESDVVDHRADKVGSDTTTHQQSLSPLLTRRLKIQKRWCGTAVLLISLAHLMLTRTPRRVLCALIWQTQSAVRPWTPALQH